MKPIKDEKKGNIVIQNHSNFFYNNIHTKLHAGESRLLEHCGTVIKHRIRDRGVAGSIPTSTQCCVLEKDTLFTLLSTDFYPGRKRAT